jgi:hypothetical protein
MKILKTIAHGISTHKSTVFMVLGIGLGAGCVVTTVLQTIKACDIIEDANSQLDDLDIVEEDEEITKLRRQIRKKTNIALAKNYIVPAALGVGSVGCTLAAYKILSSEKAAAMAALSATTAAFEKYRARVIDKYGVEADYELYHGKTSVSVKEDPNNPGKTITTKVWSPVDDNCYSKIFAFETSGEWKSSKKLNIAFLEFYERYWNQQLRTKGYVTYNEVIESLGFSRKVGTDMTEPFIPNGIGWVSEENIPEECEGMYDTIIRFVPRDIDEDELDAVYEDLGYVLRFNCYPIDNLLAKRAAGFKDGAH